MNQESMKLNKSMVVVNFRKGELNIRKCEGDIHNPQKIEGRNRGHKELTIRKKSNCGSQL